jgi:cytochrome c oxidase subunit 2
MKHGKRLKSFMLGASLLAAGLPAWAVVDSQGGPAVRQLNLQTPVTQIAEQIYSIHNLMLVICLVILWPSSESCFTPS